MDLVFEVLLEEMDTSTVHSTDIRQENHCSSAETNYTPNTRE